MTIRHRLCTAPCSVERCILPESPNLDSLRAQFGMLQHCSESAFLARADH